MKIDDTICAICTSLSKSAINIIRISGKEAISISNKILKGVDLTKKDGNTISYAHVIDKEGNVIDEVLVSLFKAPKSYTKEDVVEINTHGGAYVTSKVYELLLENGCREAENGEFTKRAYLNGRIDLTKAEAVMDIINSSTKNSLMLSNKALHGEVKKLIDRLRKTLEKILLQITVNIDYPEYIDEVQVSKDLCTTATSSLIEELEYIINRAEALRIYKEGIKTVILGKPNVGKSSLLNALLNENKAIVTSYSGTTRDIVEGEININGIILHLIDTAGIRDTDNPIEKIGIEKSLEYLDKAELILLVLDRTNMNEEDKLLLEKTSNKNRIVILNKKDIDRSVDLDIDYISLSALTKDGIDELEKKIKELFIKEDINNNGNNIISSSRHINLLKQTLSSLRSAYEGAQNGAFLDMVEIDLKMAYDYLGEITGVGYPDQLIDELFLNFCLGK